MSYKKTDALMRHLRESGISIRGQKQNDNLLIRDIFMDTRDIGFSGMHKDAYPLLHTMRSTPQFSMIQI